MISVATSAIKDHSSKWDRSFVPAPQFDVDAYQAELNKIAGLSRGEPILKLEWGGSSTVTKYTSWDLAGNPTSAQIVPRFALSRNNEILDVTEYIPVRRWIISQKNEEGQYRPWDNSDNVFTDGRGVNCEIADKTDIGHKYLPYIYIGDHSKCPKNCCATRLCLGDYKIPDGAELSYIKQITYRLANEFTADPYSPISEREIEKYRSNHRYELEKRSEAVLSEQEAETKEWLKIHGHHLDDANLKKPTYIVHKGENI